MIAAGDDAISVTQQHQPVRVVHDRVPIKRARHVEPIVAIDNGDYPFAGYFGPIAARQTHSGIVTDLLRRRNPAVVEVKPLRVGVDDFNSRHEAWRWGSSGVTLKQLPPVICANCRKAMIPSTRKRLAKGLEEVTYNCVFCGGATVRSIKPDDSNEPDEK